MTDLAVFGLLLRFVFVVDYSCRLRLDRPKFFSGIEDPAISRISTIMGLFHLLIIVTDLFSENETQSSLFNRSFSAGSFYGEAPAATKTKIEWGFSDKKSV